MPRGVPVKQDKKLYKLVVFAYFVQGLGLREIERYLKITRQAAAKIINQECSRGE